MRFQNRDCTVNLGEAIEVLRTEISDGSVDLLFADPPYNIGKRLANFVDKWPTDEDYVNWCREWLALCISKLAPHGSLYVMCSTQSIPFIDLFLRDKLHIASRLVWHYDSSRVQARHVYGSMYEPILHCVKDKQQYTFSSADISVEAKTGAKRKLIDYRKPKPAQYNASKVPETFGTSHGCATEWMSTKSTRPQNPKCFLRE